jgi:hypothetical protein
MSLGVLQIWAHMRNVGVYIHTHKHTDTHAHANNIHIMLTSTQRVKAKTHLPKTALSQHSDEFKVVDAKLVGRINPNPISFLGALLSLSS